MSDLKRRKTLNLTYVSEQLDDLRAQFDPAPDSTVMTSAMMYSLRDDQGKEYTRESPLVTMMAMPDCSDGEQRAHLQSVAITSRAFCVIVVSEAWSAVVPEGDAEGLRLVQEAQAAGVLQTIPAKYLSEVVRVFAETTEEATRCWVANIARAPDGTRSLGEFEEQGLILPRPTFRRYLPEYTTDGAIRIGIPRTV